jgi:histidinol-phosphate phosphatase family protein
MIDIVIPTVGRPSLAALLVSLARARGPRPNRIWIVDDRRDRKPSLPYAELDADLQSRLTVIAGQARGPAAARNAGWRMSRAAWIAFLDDDVIVEEDWLAALHTELADLAPDIAASYGRVRVPRAFGRKPTDWERNVAGLETAAWITADCAFRRADLQAAGGFDERFPRAYREDADLALRTLGRGKRLVVSDGRSVLHAVRPAPWWISIRLQAGNADDVLMKALHGRNWRAKAGAPHGAFGRHVWATLAAACGTLAAFAGWKVLGRVAFAVWLTMTARFAWQRIAPGPRTIAETATLVATSIVIPPWALFYRLAGAMRLNALIADAQRAPKPTAVAVLLDRDGTLIADVPFNSDPERVVPLPGARSALERLRGAGLLTAVVSNQSGIGLGILTNADVARINARTEELLGPLGPILVCPHAPADGCACRKPRPELILRAARTLGVSPRDCVMIGDIGADVEAALSAGARAVLVPTAVTQAQEIAAAPLVATDLEEAVQLVVSGRV